MVYIVEEEKRYKTIDRSFPRKFAQVEAGYHRMNVRNATSNKDTLPTKATLIVTESAAEVFVGVVEDAVTVGRATVNELKSEVVWKEVAKSVV